ncbi:MAG: paraquat-inducible protein A [Myxococcota bacterium]
MACIECDLLMTVGELAPNHRAVCPRCGFLLWSRATDGLNRALAFAAAAAVLLVMANSFPFLALKASGLESVMTLPRAVLELFHEGYGTIATIVIAFIIVIPALVIGLIVALVVQLGGGRSRPWLVPAGRLLFSLATWSMAEVFIIGVIVSLVKIGQLATVVIGPSFWSYAAFAICFTAALANLDRLEVWTEIERCTA